MRTGTRVPFTIVAPLAIVLLAGACSGDNGGAQAGACDGEIAEGDLTMFAHEGSEADAYRSAIESFNSTRGAEIGVTVELTMIPEGQYTDQINAAAAAGDLPDIIDLDGPNMANLAWGKHLVSIDDCVSEELRANVLPSLIQQGTYADKLYALGSFDSGLGLWAWRSALEEVDARIPTEPGDAWTIDEFETILGDLQEAGYEHPLDTKFWYGSQGEWFSYAFTPILWSAGAGLIDRTDYQSADGTLNSAEAAASLTTFQSWVTEGLIDKDAADDSNFVEKRSPISWVGHWMYQPYKEAAGDDLVLLPLPDFGSGSKTGMGSWAWAMTSAAADGDAAFAVIEYLMSDDAILGITEVNGAIPGTSSAIAKSSNHAEGGDLALYVTQLKGAPDIAVPRPVTPAYPNMTQVFRTVIDDIVNGADVQATLDAAVEAIDEDISANEGYPPPSE